MTGGEGGDGSTALPAGGSALFLWSTNAYLKLFIQQTFFKDLHYVWCSPIFDPATLNKYAPGSGLPASSDPASIYRQLHKAVKGGDGGDAKIASQKKILKAVAMNACEEQRISQDARDEIVAIIKKASFKEWRPLIYAIPFAAVASRVELVPVPKRAGIEREYIIRDLGRHEFELIEPMPCP